MLLATCGAIVLVLTDMASKQAEKLVRIWAELRDLDKAEAFEKQWDAAVASSGGNIDVEEMFVADIRLLEDGERLIHLLERAHQRSFPDDEIVWVVFRGPRLHGGTLTPGSDKYCVVDTVLS